MAAGIQARQAPMSELSYTERRHAPIATRHALFDTSHAASQDRPQPIA
jgi:hypothetical protein